MYGPRAAVRRMDSHEFFLAQKPEFRGLLSKSRQISETNSMNVRSVSNPITPLDLKRTDETQRTRLDESHQDRDANGRREQPEPDQSPLSEEELKKAEEYFAGLTGLKANGLSIELEESAGQVRVFVIRDPQGTVVRRIPEFEMRLLIQDKDRKSGQLFDRAG